MKHLPVWAAIWADKFNALSIRERSLVAAALLAIVSWLCFLPMESLYLARQQQEIRLTELDKQNDLDRQLLSNYQQRLTQDPNLDYHNQLKHLEREKQLLDGRLEKKLVDIVPSHQMPLLLQQLLSRTQGVQLMDMKSIAPTPLIDFNPLIDVKDNDTKASSSLNLFRHGIKLRLTTDYFSFLAFVEAIDALPNKLYWKRLDYQVTEFPHADVELELYTLSISKEFISVAKTQ